MKKRERLLLFVTIAVAALALSYVYVIEPVLSLRGSSSTSALRNRKYLDILSRRNVLQAQAHRVWASNYWKQTSPEQRIALELYIGEISRKAGVRQIQNILPLPSRNDDGGSEVIAFQINAECSLDALTRLLYSVGASEVPLQVRKLQIFGETGDQGQIRVQIDIASIWMPGIGRMPG